MIAIDTETTGIDLRHGAKPFLVTTCTDDGEIRYWEWPVNPLTRQPQIPQEEVDQIGDYLFADGPHGPGPYVLQNPKFDFAALKTIGMWQQYDVWAVWQDVFDTLRAGHVLASNQPHDLTTMALIYLGVNILPYEEATQVACNEARRIARSQYPEWRIAKDGLPEMPSAKGSLWKNDLWLPRAIAIEKNYPDDHPWWTVTSEYANMDSSVTVEMFKVMMDKLKDRGLWGIYLECLKVQRIAYKMEDDGITVNKKHLAQLTEEYKAESDKCHRVIQGVARSYNYELDLPKGAVNNSLRTFCFDVLKLEPIRNPKAKSDAPSLDSKNAIPHYLRTLPPNSLQMTFVKNLVAKRARDTALSYMESYTRFGIPLENYYDRTIHEQSEEDKDMLDLEGGVIHKRVRAVQSVRREQSPQSQLSIVQGGHPRRKASTPQVRQPEMCQSKSSTSWNSSLQHERHDPQEERQKSKGVSTSSSDRNREGYFRVEEAIQLRSTTSRLVSKIQIEQASRLCNSPPSVLEAHLKDWMVLHPSLNPTGTDTLRWSSSSPNEQNISKREGFNLRYCFGPAPGREWWSMDAKNIELRIPAYESGEEAFIDLFERPDDPPYFGSNHLLIAHLLFPKEFDECIKLGLQTSGDEGFKKKYKSTLYQRVKNGNFAVQYGAVDRADGMGTADRTYGLKGAQARIASRFAKQDALNKYWVKFAESNGYVETMPDKTVDPKRGYPLYCARTAYGGIKPTVPLNYHVQGTAMWWMMKAMIRCQEQLDEWNAKGFDGRIALQVHDELVFDFPRRANPKTNPKASNLWRIRILQKLMSKGGEDIGVPTPVSVEYHELSWDEGVGV